MILRETSPIWRSSRMAASRRDSRRAAHDVPAIYATADLGADSVMRLFDIIAVLITLSALFSWFNYRFLKLPTAIGLMLIALLMSLTLLLPIPGSDGLERDVKRMLDSIPFDETVLHGMLGFLLFAGALACQTFGSGAA